MNVSVVIPTYNRARLVERAIQSAVHQTFPPMEIVVVDDGSTDDTEAAVNGIRVSSPRIRYIRQENRGVSAARNEGIRQVNGDLIAFLDSDDEWLPNKLQKQVEVFLQDAEIGMVCADDEIITPRGIRPKPPIAHHLAGGEHYYDFLMKNFVPTSSIIVKKKVLDRTGGFDESLECYEDYDLWLRISEVTKVAVLSDKLSRYHDHGTGSITNDIGREKTFKSAVEVLEKARLRSPEKVERYQRDFNVRLSGFYFDLGCVYYRQKKYSQALNSFLKHTNLRPFAIKGAVFCALSAVRTAAGAFRMGVGR